MGSAAVAQLAERRPGKAQPTVPNPSPMVPSPWFPQHPGTMPMVPPVPPASFNPFLQVDLQAEVRGFLEWAKGRLSPKAYDNVVRYSRFIYYLAMPHMLSQALEQSGLGPWGRHHVLKVLSNFAKYLDLKYSTEVFSEAWRRIRKASGLKWSVEKPLPSLSERLENPEEVLPKIINAIDSWKHRLFALLLLATGLRPEEAEYLWEHYDERVKEIDGIVVAELMLTRKTKNAYFAFIPPRLHEEIKRLRARGKALGRIDLKKFRASWRRACEKAGVDHRKWPPYSLRKMHATLLKRRLSESDVDLLQGRAPKTVLAQHYNVESLRTLWNGYMETVGRLVEELLAATEHGDEAFGEGQSL